jgi:hypothetical protein
MEMPVAAEQLLTPMVAVEAAALEQLGQVTQELLVVPVVLAYQTLLELDRLFTTAVVVLEEATIPMVLRDKVEMAEAEMVTPVTMVFLILPHMLILMVMQIQEAAAEVLLILVEVKLVLVRVNMLEAAVQVL